MKIFLSALLLFAFLLTSLPLNGQSLSGFVKDATNGETLITVNVFLKDTGIGTVTNRSGYYIIPRLPAGKWTVVFTYIGYERLEKEITASPGVSQKLSVQLVPRPVETETITVVSERISDAENIKPSSITITPRKIETVPQMAEPDLMRMLQTMPGVLALSEFSSGLYIRGGTPDQNLILLDGTELYNVNHLFGLFSAFDVDAVKEAELMKGGFPARYGGRMSSVLDITNKDGNQKTIQGKTSVGLVSAKASLEGPIGRGSWFISGRRTYLNLILNAMESLSGEDAQETLATVPDYYFWDVHFKFYQDLSFRNKVALTYYQGSDVMNFDVDPFNFKFKWGNRALTARWTHIFNDRLFVNTQATWSRYAILLDEDDVLINAEYENGITDITGKMDIEYDPVENHSIAFGLLFKNRSAYYSQAYGIFDYTIRSSSSECAGYLQDTWNLTNLLTLQAGMRWTWYIPLDFSFTYNDVSYQGKSTVDWEPRLSLRYRWNESLSTKVAWGRYRQYITIVTFGNSDFSFMDLWFPCDNSYEPGEAYHTVTGLEARLPWGLSLTLEAYYKDMPHVYEFNPNTTSLASGVALFYTGSGYSYGGDLYLEKTAGHFTGWVSYALGWVYRVFPDLNGGLPYFPKYDRRHTLDIVGSYQLSRNWSVNASWSYGTGQAYTRSVSQYHVEMPDRTVPLIIGEQRNVSRLPAYHRMDIGAHYLKTTRSRILKKWGFYIEIFNVYNRRNVWFRNVNLREKPPQDLEIRMLPLIPTAGFEFYF